MKNNEFKRYIYTGLTAVAVIAVCIVFWYCIQYWSEVARVIHMIIGIVAPIIYGAVLADWHTPPSAVMCCRLRSIILKVRENWSSPVS